MSILKNLTILVLSALFLFNCQEREEPTLSAGATPPEKYFVAATPGDETSRATLQLMANAFGGAEIADSLKYDVRTYTITYSTTYKDTTVQASGLLMIPVGMNGPAPIVSVQHGTTFEKEDAPSVRGGFQGIEFLASAGYIALMPDFLGYGESSQLFHPYYDREHSALAVIDMVKAAREFLEGEKIAFNDKLFLAGYSEGGYVTLAAAHELDTDDSHGLNVSAVAAGAGGYDLPEMLNAITEGSYYAYPSYLAFVLMSYNYTFDWNRPLNYFFKDQYAEALAKFMNGEYSGSYINSKLTTNVPELFNTMFLQGLRDNAAESELKKALAENSVAGWRTEIPIRLFHGTKDEIIPYQNSEITLEKFKQAGSPDVTLTLIPNGTHGNSFEHMLRDFIPWFLGL